MTQFIDRRLNGKKKSTVNRQRFIERFKKQIKEAVSTAVTKRSITDIENGERINIPTKDTQEPVFSHGNGGNRSIVHPGNEEFVKGDKIKRPPSSGGEGKGEKASNQGEGQDDFAFSISRDEFLELFFEDLELPDLMKTQISKLTVDKFVRAGYTSEGVPTNIHVVRSLKNAIARRRAIAGPLKKQLRETDDAVEQALKEDETDEVTIMRLRKESEHLAHRIKRIPFIDTFDLRYNHRVKQARPNTSAVMFCLMDVSGSMDEVKKDIAKRFFILLYLFLRKNYDKIDLVFIRHHTSAKEVDEEEFFYSRETGGTVVSSALELAKDVMAKRYPSTDWNVYMAQASDGDNWNADSPYCEKILTESILPSVQYYAYVEIMPRHHQSLWHAYLRVKERFDTFSMQNIHSATDIYPVFRELFKRKESA